MNENKVYELPCFDGRQSFYGKALVIEYGNGDRTLQSYATPTCKLKRDGTFVKLNPVATPTTRRHIRSFLRLTGSPEINNRTWDKLPLQEEIRLAEVSV